MRIHELLEANIQAHRQGNTIWIDYFEVPVRGKGMGSREYRDWESKLPQDITKIRLHASDAGHGPSHGFWDQMGFDYEFPDDDNQMIKYLKADDSLYEDDEWKIDEVAKVKISTDPNDFGAYVRDGGKDEPTVMLPIKKINQVLEPDDLHQTKPGAPERIKNMVIAIRQGKSLPPILVRRHKLGYQVLDGHHRFKAYKIAKATEIPARIVDPKNITVSEIEVIDRDSNDDGIRFKLQKGKNKFATTLSVSGKTVGIYQYNANTGRSIAEVYPEFKGKGFGKLLVLHAIYTATQLGLDFQEDESRTSEYDNVLDSLSSNGYIVDDDGYWYVTGEGEQYLKKSLEQGLSQESLDETLKKVKGKWALVSKHDPKKVLQYYHGSGHPSKEWVSKVERRVHSFGEDQQS